METLRKLTGSLALMSNRNAVDHVLFSPSAFATACRHRTRSGRTNRSQRRLWATTHYGQNVVSATSEFGSVATGAGSHRLTIRNLSIVDPHIFELGRLVLGMPVRRCREQ